jgi:hypothetical protein
MTMVITSSTLLINNGFPYLLHQAIAQKIIEQNNSSGNKGLQNQNIQLTFNNKILLAKLLANNLRTDLANQLQF